jgi:hypothetical protein
MNTTSRAPKKEGKFRPGDYPSRRRADRVGCGSFERRRLLKLWWDSSRSHSKTPEYCILFPKIMLRNSPAELPNKSFDFVIC